MGRNLKIGDVVHWSHDWEKHFPSIGTRDIQKTHRGPFVVTGTTTENGITINDMAGNKIVRTSPEPFDPADWSCHFFKRDEFLTAVHHAKLKRAKRHAVA